MTGDSRQQELELPPRASSLVESLRDMGYSLRTALADVIDNSITAGTRNIQLFADTHHVAPAIGILDDGAVRCTGWSSTSTVEITSGCDSGTWKILQ